MEDTSREEIKAAFNEKLNEQIKMDTAALRKLQSESGTSGILLQGDDMNQDGSYGTGGGRLTQQTRGSRQSQNLFSKVSKGDSPNKRKEQEPMEFLDDETA
jgi:hypothetical protein